MAIASWESSDGGYEAEADEEVSTVLIGGLPNDATPRELDNFCRFMPGFVNSKVDNRRGTMLFVRFDTALNAQTAIGLITGQMFDRTNPGEALRATMARSNMRKTDAPSKGGGAFAPAAGGWQNTWHKPPSYPSPPSLGAPSWSRTQSYPSPPASKRPRTAGDPNQIDTVACVGAHEMGFDEGSLETFFASLPGFVIFKHNPKMGGGFAKFTSPEGASEAIMAAQEQGVPAAFAKSSMTYPSKQETWSGGHHAYPAGQPPPPNTPPPTLTKRVRPVENPNSVDTVACVGAAEAGWDEAMLLAFFSAVHGYMAFKPNPRMGGAFVKFGTPQLAAEAVAAAQAEGIPASIARSSMSSVNG